MLEQWYVGYTNRYNATMSCRGDETRRSGPSESVPTINTQPRRRPKTRGDDHSLPCAVEATTTNRSVEHGRRGGPVETPISTPSQSPRRINSRPLDLSFAEIESAWLCRVRWTSVGLASGDVKLDCNPSGRPLESRRAYSRGHPKCNCCLLRRPAHVVSWMDGPLPTRLVPCHGHRPIGGFVRPGLGTLQVSHRGRPSQE